MKKLRLAIIIVFILSLMAWIGLCIWAIVGGINVGQDIAQQAVNEGAENGSAVGGAIAGAAVGTLSITFFIAIGILFGIYAFNTLIALIIYVLVKRKSIIGGLIAFLFASPIAGILIIIESCKSN